MSKQSAQSCKKLFQEGYAKILGISSSQLSEPGTIFVSTPVRSLPEWANWVHPIWFFALDDTLICSVAPHFDEEAKTILASIQGNSLLDSKAREVAGFTYQTGVEWVQCELFCYLSDQPPAISSSHKVEDVKPDDPNAQHLFRNFDGGVYAIRNSEGQIVSQAAVKNKGIINEIAVGTQPNYRRQGMGATVVAYAVQQILAKGRIPTYWPDRLDNVGSYAIAQAVGFQKIADMLFCCYPESDWPGFIHSVNRD